MNKKLRVLIAFLSVISGAMVGMDVDKESETKFEKNDRRYEGVPVSYHIEHHPASLYNQPLINQENQGENEREIIQERRWGYRCCPTPYYEEECTCKYCWNRTGCGGCTRGCVSTVSASLAAFCGAIKFFEWCCSNDGESCAYACSTRECTSIWFPTACPNVHDGVCSIISWGFSLGSIGGGITALGAWAPWWDDRGCILYKRVRMDQE